MSRSRYEPVPQREEVIILDSIMQNGHYNYNSGIPNSVPSSAAPSYYAPSSSHPTPTQAPVSAPGSPPPSFHTLSSPGTPRPTPSTHTLPNSQYAELWGVAPSTTGAQTDVCAASDALATIAHLKARIERLEESLGQLLLDKEENDSVTRDGQNCCMTFTDASETLERRVTATGGNCCVTFRKTKGMSEAEIRRERMLFRLMAVALVCVTVVLLSFAWTAKEQHSGPRGMKEGMQ